MNAIPWTRVIRGKTWDVAPLGFESTLEEAKKHATNIRKGGYHTYIVRVKNTETRSVSTGANSRPRRVKEVFYSYVIYRRWDKKIAPKDCSPNNVLGRKRS